MRVVNTTRNKPKGLKGDKLSIPNTVLNNLADVENRKTMQIGRSNALGNILTPDALKSLLQKNA